MTAGHYFMHPHSLAFTSSLHLAAAAVFLSAWLCLGLLTVRLYIYCLRVSPQLQFALLPANLFAINHMLKYLGVNTETRG